jgi:hypothetical protein
MHSQRLNPLLGSPEQGFCLLCIRNGCELDSIHIARLAKASQLYIHAPRGRAGRSIVDSTERFVEATTRMGPSA